MSQTQVQSGFIGDNSVTSAQIAANAITTAKLDSTVSNALVPIGGIIMWSGSVATIPSSWSLCNGANGTPNLQDKFLVGAGSGYAVGATGGAASVSLTEAQMPSHKHGYVYATGTFIDGNGTTDHVDQGNINELEQGAGPDGQRLRKYFASTSSKGSGTAHENRPPYYALAFIMRVS
jgi:microcystin-dependent protein